MTLKSSLNVFFPEDIRRTLLALASASRREPCADFRAGYVSALRDVALAHGLGIEAFAAAPEPKRLIDGGKENIYGT